MRAALSILVLVLAACGNPSVIDGKYYKNSCSLPSDCVAVFFGDQCGVCDCGNAAINASDKVTYDADRSAAIATCGPRPAVACAPCQARQLTCTAGVCGIQ